jgi:signal transduction histidine kinase
VRWLAVPRKRALLLFLFALSAPLAVLTITGWRLTDRERELERGRAAAMHRQELEQCAQAVLTRLEQIKLAYFAEATREGARIVAARPAEPVALIGLVRGNELILPWDQDPRVGSAGRELRDPDFSALMSAAERESTPPAAALEACERAEAKAATAAQKAYAGVARARLLRRAGKNAESLRQWRAVLALPSDVVDENGIPFAFYALPNLQAIERAATLRDVAADALRKRPFIAPAALYLARDAVGQAPGLDAAIRECERAKWLQQNFAELGLSVHRPEPQWVAAGDPVWLVGTTPAMRNGEAIALAVRAAAILSAAYPKARIAANGETLGATLPGLRVIVDPHPETRPASVVFIWIAVAFAATAAVAGTALLWRDMRREARLAELRSQFIASVSHELRTPLAAIRMFAETMKLDADLDERDRGEYLDTILRESERLSRLVDNVLNFSRMEQGRTTYRMAAVALDELIEASSKALQPALEQAGFRLSVALEPGLPSVQADRDAVQQAILNLLTNAMKYSGPAREVELRAERRDGFAQISVADHGIGIPADERRRIFERFYRAPVSENQSIPGAGLGLALVEHIARSHGGDVQVDSEPGRGSTFTLRLPLVAAAQAHGEA